MNDHVPPVQTMIRTLEDLEIAVGLDQDWEAAAVSLTTRCGMLGNHSHEPWEALVRWLRYQRKLLLAAVEVATELSERVATLEATVTGLDEELSYHGLGRAAPWAVEAEEAEAEEGTVQQLSRDNDALRTRLGAAECDRQALQAEVESLQAQVEQLQAEVTSLEEELSYHGLGPSSPWGGQ